MILLKAIVALVAYAAIAICETTAASAARVDNAKLICKTERPLFLVMFPDVWLVELDHPVYAALGEIPDTPRDAIAEVASYVSRGGTVLIFAGSIGDWGARMDWRIYGPRMIRILRAEFVRLGLRDDDVRQVAEYSCQDEPGPAVLIISPY